MKASLYKWVTECAWVQVAFQLACGLGFLDGEVTPKLRGNNGSHSVNLNKEKENKSKTSRSGRTFLNAVNQRQHHNKHFTDIHPIQESFFPPLMKEKTDRTGSILKAGLHLGPYCGLWAICPISMETTYQLEKQNPPPMEELQGSYLDSPLPKRIP